MKSRAVVFLGLLFSVLLLISSVVVAEKTSKEEKKEVQAKEPNQKYGGGQICSFGCCGYSSYGRCSSCCRNAAEARAFEIAQAKRYGEGAYYGGGGYGGGRGGWGRGGGRCCGDDDGDAQSKENEAKKP
ncbi:late embryogenesis abundant protein M17-like [Actinidia eriantha]|uniref:late embryogenesis abundant protein M17-like n=1 Tax=Actinidia eriantha TaxID=165200 RepID=UPI00258B839E|nr:late embryogenesis abundant protein M17-like [Actinidia eriantha]